MTASPRYAFAVAILLTTGAGDSCGNPSPSAPVPKGPVVVDVTLSEYRFGFTKPTLIGRTEFRFVNEGRKEHRPSLIPLSEDFPPIDEQVRGHERRVITPVAGVVTRPPGTQGGFAVDLEPDRRYAFVCFVRDEDGRSHAVEGMTAEFRTPPEPIAAQKQQARGRVSGDR